MTKMAEPTEGDQPGTMTREKAQVIIDLFRATHPSASAEIGHFVDSIIHGPGDDVPDLDRVAEHSGAFVSSQAAQAAVEFVMAAMLMASR
ncbi:MAG TPA: hypothetical protein VEG33_13075 [Streptosporangiaceae bacterium]|nr:hypothetical protein [Streptosporangiaceae bacterium]